jgi:hypothetical protein
MDINKILENLDEAIKDIDSCCEYDGDRDATLLKLREVVSMLQSADEDLRIVNLRAWMESARAGNCFIRPIDILEFLNG